MSASARTGNEQWNRSSASGLDAAWLEGLASRDVSENRIGRDVPGYTENYRAAGSRAATRSTPSRARPEKRLKMATRPYRNAGVVTLQLIGVKNITEVAAGRSCAQRYAKTRNGANRIQSALRTGSSNAPPAWCQAVADATSSEGRFVGWLVSCLPGFWCSAAGTNRLTSPTLMLVVVLLIQT